MTQNSGFSTILSLGGLVELNTYTYVNNALPDPDPANTQGGFRPLITAVSTGQAITAVNTGVNRLWIWDILVYKYVSPSNNLYQPGAATYQTFYTSGSIYSAGIPVELQNLIDNPGNEPDYQYIVLVVDWRSTVSQLLKNDEDRPSYYSLIGGYGLDNR